MNNTPLFKKSDFLIIAICLLVALIIFLPSVFSSDDTLTAVIAVDGKTVREIVLTDSTDETLEINNTIIKAQGRSICFHESSCPDKTCVRTGKLDSAGDSSACVPNRVSVYIKGEKNSNDIDIMSY